MSTSTAKAGNARFRGYGVVFTVDGNPIIPRPCEVPAEAWKTLSAEEKNYANSQVPAELQYID